MSSDVRFVKQEDIDKTKWNSCVHFASHGHLYGYMWYLNNVAREWDALIEGDYETVFPLFKKRQFGRGSSLYQPDLVRETGIYSNNILSAKRIEKMLKAIPKEYENIDLVLNEGVKPPPNLGFDISTQVNHQLLLKFKYEELAGGYSPQVNEELAKAMKNDLIITSNVKPEKIADFYKKYTKDKKNVEKKFHAYQRIMYNALHRGWGFASGISLPNGEICAAAFFVFSHGRLLRLVSSVSPIGKEKGAEALTYDMILRTNADRHLILDFNSGNQDFDPTIFGAQAVHAYRIQKKKKVLGIF